MSKKVEKLITVSCSICSHIFIAKVEIKKGSEENQTTEIDLSCPECKSLLTVKIDGKISLDSISLKQYKGIAKGTTE